MSYEDWEAHDRGSFKSRPSLRARARHSHVLACWHRGSFKSRPSLRGAGYQLLTRLLVSIGHRCIERAAVALDDTGRSTSVRTRIHR
jgi:hypothetical protein